MKKIILILCLFSTSLLAKEKNVFTVLDIPDEFSEAKSIYPKYINVFGLHIFASNKVRDKKIIHAANILAEYLDNNEDGVPDNLLVVDKMVKHKAALFMSKDDRAWGRDIDKFWRIYGYKNLRPQSLYDIETNPGGGEFDASLEEVLHLITEKGYAFAYPSELGSSTSFLAKAMDKARGGKFKSVPKKYPKGAWYSYYDKTCSYRCMKAEYIYWALTSYLGAQKNRRNQISNEWRAYTKEKLIMMDPDVTKLITNPKYKFPTKLPDGHYNAPVNAYKAYVNDIKLNAPNGGEICDWIIDEAFRDHLQKDPSSNMHFYVVIGRDGRCEYGEGYGKDTALKNCEKYRKENNIQGECKPYAIGKEIVWGKN